MKERYKERDKGRFNGNNIPVNAVLVEHELYWPYKGMAHRVMKIHMSFLLNIP